MKKNIFVRLCVIFFVVSSVSFAADTEVILDSSDATSGFSVKDSLGGTVMRAGGDGNFGIGTTSPGEKLEVKGRIKDKTGFVMPVGAILPYGGPVAPTGWLVCDGSVVLRTTYDDLFTAIGTAWGYGDGASTFNLPDFRGRFLRGRNNGAGRDPNAGSRTASALGGNSGDNVGSIQNDAFQGHKLGGGGGTVRYSPGRTDVSPPNGYSYMNQVINNFGVNGAYGSVSELSPISDGSNGTPRTASETRSKNAYVNYIIKY